ncbi:MAG: FG-GAP repeat domain-containing protein [Opitutales bacterium]
MNTKTLAISLAATCISASAALGLDKNKPGWFDDVTDNRLPEILETVTFGTLEADFGDLDNDGDLDIVMANDGKEPLVILWNDGNAWYQDYQLIPIPGRVAADVDFGDVNADGYLDIVVGMADFYGAQNRLLLNNRDGTFTDATELAMPKYVDNTRDTDFVDVDYDGDLDIIVANVVIMTTNEKWQNKIYINNGFGIFSDETLTPSGEAYRFPIDKASTRSILPMDVNEDGYVDFVMANRFDSPLWGQGYDGPKDKVWINDGNGFFHDESFRLPDEEDSGRDLNKGDIDGDGDEDLIIGNAIGSTELYNGGGQQNRVLINDGNGYFTDETLTAEGERYRFPVLENLTKSVDIVDIDNDGDLDVLTANSRGENGFLAPQPGQQNRIYINDGTGFFNEESVIAAEQRLRFPARFDNCYDLDLADIDGDGDLDIFLGIREETCRLLINRTLDELGF